MKSQIQLPHQQYRVSLDKKYRELTKEEKKEYRRLQFSAISDEWKEQYRTQERNRSREYRKKLTDEQKEKRRQYMQEYEYSLTDEQKEKRRQYMQEYSREYYKSYTPTKKTQIGMKFRCWIHNNAKRGDGTKESWIEHVGCTKDEFITHIESQFVEGMSWDNWSSNGWHMDHIIPLSKGGTNHYTNLQPLWAKDNLSKSDKLV